MRTVILQAALLLQCIVLCGCHNPIRGTWLQTGKANVALDGSVEHVEVERPSVLVFRNDGWNREYTIRNDRLELIGEGKYKAYKNRLTYIITGHFAGEITGQFARDGDQLMIDLAAREGYDREIYQKID